MNALSVREAAAKVGIPYQNAYHIVRFYVANGHRMTFPTDPPLEKEKKLDPHKDWLLEKLHQWQFVGREERAERIYNALNIKVTGVTLLNWYKKVSEKIVNS